MNLSTLADFLIEVRPSVGKTPTLDWPWGIPQELKESIMANSDGCPWSEVIVHNYRGKTYTRASHWVTARAIERPPLIEAEKNVVRAIQDVIGDPHGTQLVRDYLCKAGFLREVVVDKEWVTTDLTYMSCSDFVRLVQRELARKGEAKRVRIDETVLRAIWSCLSRLRPSGGNELHFINSKAEDVSDPGARTPPPIAVKQPA